MSPEHSRQADEIVRAARAFARLGYMHGFGHISVRNGDGVLITPTRPPFLDQRSDNILVCNSAGVVETGDATTRPIEVFLHLAVYKARKDVHAICRTHAPAASSIQSLGSVPPIRHGFGGIAETVAVFDQTDLIHKFELGQHAATCLGSADALILRGNGVLTVGATLGQAAARMWSLEERCTFEQLTPDKSMYFSASELEARKCWYAAESERIWVWLQQIGS